LQRTVAFLNKKAVIVNCTMSAFGFFADIELSAHMSAFGGKADTTKSQSISRTFLKFNVPNE